MPIEVAPRHEPEPGDARPALYAIGDLVVVGSSKELAAVERAYAPCRGRDFWLYDVIVRPTGRRLVLRTEESLRRASDIEILDELTDGLPRREPPEPKLPELRRAPASVKESNPKDVIGATKVPLSLCSPVAKARWAEAQFAGLCKYGSFNWRAIGVRSMIYLDAIDRHRDAYLSGEEFDPVDGTHHLGNIMACCAILLDAAAAGKLTDDRPPSVDIRPTYEAVQAQMVKLREQYEHMQPRHYTIADTERVDNSVLIPHEDAKCGAV